jgi:hypothetical protein
MRLQSAVIECEVVGDLPIPQAVIVGDQRIENIAEARVHFDPQQPLALVLKIFVQDVRSLLVSPGCHVEQPAKRLVPIPGAPGSLCELGDIPKSGYTIGELRAALEHFPQDAKVGFCLGVGSNLEVASHYQAPDTGAVWFDLEEAD